MLLADFEIPTGWAPSDEEPSDSALGFLQEMQENDALYVTEDTNFDLALELASCFSKLPAAARASLLETLTSNLEALAASAAALLEEWASAASGAVAAHRAALKMHVFLLHCVATQAQEEADRQAQPGAGTGRGRGGAKKAPAKGRRGAAFEGDDDDGTAAGTNGANWDWDWGRAAVLRALQPALGVDLRALFGGLAGVERMAGLGLDMAISALESRTAALARSEPLRTAAYDVIAHCSLRYGLLGPAAALLVVRTRRHDHLAALAAGAAKFAEEEHNSTQLAVALLAEFSRFSPAELDDEARANATAVTRAATLLAHIADLMPAAAANQISLLRPFLACSSTSVRGAVLSAVGSVLQKVYHPGAISGDTAAGAAQAHLRSKQALMELLRARVLDKGAYVRQRALHVWTSLVDAKCVPLSWWNVVVGLGVGRLEDESQLVVRAALRLLFFLITNNPFGPTLATDRFAATLAHLEGQLEAMGPEAGGGGEEGEEEEGGERWEEGDVKMEETGEGDEEAAAAAADAPARRRSVAPGANGGSDQGPAAAAGADRPADESVDTPHRGRLPADARRAELRHLVATLKEAIAFCRRLEGALPTLRALLAAPHGEVVQDTVSLLTLCRRFGVPGAARALRGMWPLVFAREEAVRAAVLDAWSALYLDRLSPKEQAQGLLEEVMPGCTLGELSALEAILKALAAPPARRLPVSRLLRPLMAVPMAEYRRAAAGDAPGDAGVTPGDAAGATGDGGVRDQGAGGEEEAAAAERRASRMAFQLLSLLAAASPEDFVPHAPAITAMGFSKTLQDPFIQRHTCIILSQIAPALLSPSAARELAAASDAARAASDEDARRAFLRRTHEQITRLLLAPPVAVQTAAVGAAESGAEGEDSAAENAAGKEWGKGAEGAAGGAKQGGVQVDRNWPAVAEAAVGALYALHPRPHALVGAVLQRLATAAGLLDAALCQPSAAGMTRFCSVLGAAAINQLALSERLLRSARAGRAAAGRAAAQAAADTAYPPDNGAGPSSSAAGGGSGSGKGAAGRKKKGQAAAGPPGTGAEDDIAAQLGVGAVSVDELDAIGVEIEGQILAQNQLLGGYTSLLSAFCFRRSFLDAPAPLQAAALLALTKLMAVDGRLCQGSASPGGRDNVGLLFTLLLQRRVPPSVRCNVVVALGDLASRWPNALEPWTWAMYEPLGDPSPGVRSCCLSVLTHLVLGGRVKAKGSVAKVARLMVDEDPGIQARARLFFSQLAKSGTGGGARGGGGGGASAAAGASAANPVYNLLPDILSTLCREPGLEDGSFRAIMGELLPYIKDRQADALRERLALRMEHAPGSAREWRWLAFCLGQLGYSEKACRRLAEVTRAYKHALGEDEVYEVFKGFADKARKAAQSGRTTTADPDGPTSADGPPGSAPGASQGPGNPMGSSIAPGEIKDKMEEWGKVIEEARAAALEAKAVEEAAAMARAGGAAAAARRRASLAAAAEGEGAGAGAMGEEVTAGSGDGPEGGRKEEEEKEQESGGEITLMASQYAFDEVTNVTAAASTIGGVSEAGDGPSVDSLAPRMARLSVGQQASEGDVGTGSVGTTRGGGGRGGARGRGSRGRGRRGGAASAARRGAEKEEWGSEDDGDGGESDGSGGESCEEEPRAPPTASKRAAAGGGRRAGGRRAVVLSDSDDE